jgi:acyl dehydratase
MLTLDGIAQLEDRVGQLLGTSDWHEVTQERITAFAHATDDFERIHLDDARGREAGLGGTIAHGLYTLSLGPKFLYEIYALKGPSLSLNYGFEKVRFLSPVKVGSRVRMTATLASVAPITGGRRVTITQTFEIEGQDKPAAVADAVVAYFD